MSKRKPYKPTGYYLFEDVYKAFEETYTFVIQPEFYGKITYLVNKKKKKSPQNKTPL